MTETDNQLVIRRMNQIGRGITAVSTAVLTYCLLQVVIDSGDRLTWLVLAGWNAVNTAWAWVVFDVGDSALVQAVRDRRGE